MIVDHQGKLIGRFGETQFTHVVGDQVTIAPDPSLMIHRPEMHEHTRIRLRLCGYQCVVVHRPAVPDDRVEPDFADSRRRGLWRVGHLDAAGEPVRYLLPPGVAQFIDKSDLYT